MTNIWECAWSHVIIIIIIINGPAFFAEHNNNNDGLLNKKKIRFDLVCCSNNNNNNNSNFIIIIIIIRSNILHGTVKIAWFGLPILRDPRKLKKFFAWMKINKSSCWLIAFDEFDYMLTVVVAFSSDFGFVRDMGRWSILILTTSDTTNSFIQIAQQRTRIHYWCIEQQ